MNLHVTSLVPLRILIVPPVAVAVSVSTFEMVPAPCASSQVAPGAIAVLLLNQAGWHIYNTLVVPANIVITHLPPKCPELNPTENIWQLMRDNCLSNRVFKSYTDIVDHCCEAWKKLMDQPWRIMSIGLRDWAHGY